MSSNASITITANNFIPEVVVGDTIDTVFSANSSNTLVTGAVNYLAIKVDKTDPGITLNSNTEGSVANIQGEYTLTLFPGGEYQYVDRNETTNTQNPKKVGSINDVPGDAVLFNYSPSLLEEVTVTYTVVANTTLNNPTEEEFVQTVRQNWTAGRDSLREFFE